VGSGRGTFLWPLLDAFPELPVTAIDKSPRRATDLGATRNGGITRLAAHEMDVLALDFAPRSFDVVTALEVLEHIEDTGRAVSQLLKVASRAIVVSVPSKPDDNPEHIHLFDGPGLARIFRAHGARKVAIDHVFDHMILLVSP
jgi:2-polyprenyl-3-methyl-5-hydroxy-6-metoxy-1,4-benzoquinol methylase